MYRKRVVRKYKTKPKATSKSQLATKSYVKRLIKGTEELKRHCIQEQGLSLSVGTVYFNRPVEGIDQDPLTGNRIGSEIILKYIDIYHRVVNLNGGENGYLRLLVVEDKGYEATNGLEMFQSVNLSSNDPITYDNTGKVDQIYWPFNKQRWTVYYDTRVKLADPAQDSYLSEKIIKKRVFINRKIKYTDTTNPETLAKPNLKTIWFTEVMAGATWTNPITCSFSHTMYYTDA